MNYLPKRMQTAHSIHYYCFLSFGIADTLTLEADFARENSSITCDYLNQLNQFRKRITRKIFSLITDWGLIKYCLEAEKETLFHACFFNSTETEKCGRKEKWQREVEIRNWKFQAWRELLLKKTCYVLLRVIQRPILFSRPFSWCSVTAGYPEFKKKKNFSFEAIYYIQIRCSGIIKHLWMLFYILLEFPRCNICQFKQNTENILTWNIQGSKIST